MVISSPPKPPLATHPFFSLSHSLYVPGSLEVAKDSVDGPGQTVDPWVP